MRTTHIASPGSRVALAALFAGLALAGWKIAPVAASSWEWLAARDDPAALTDLGLKRDLNQASLDSGLASALESGDIDLAGSYLTLADQQRIAPAPALAARYAAATTAGATAWRGLGEFYTGAIHGEASGEAGLAGVVASDLSGVGDVRDLIGEAGKMARGEEPDRLLMGLAAVGLAVTGATIASRYAALPARAGVSALKVAARSGRISAPLAADLARLGAAAVETRTAAVAVTRLRRLAVDVSMVERRAGMRGVFDALGLARDPAEVGRVARLAEARGGGLRATLKILGRGALVLGSGAAMLAGWVVAGVGWAWFALWGLVFLGRRALLLLIGLLWRLAKAARWMVAAGVVAAGLWPRPPKSVPAGLFHAKSAES